MYTGFPQRRPLLYPCVVLAVFSGYPLVILYLICYPPGIAHHHIPSFYYPFSWISLVLSVLHYSSTSTYSITP